MIQKTWEIWILNWQQGKLRTDLIYPASTLKSFRLGVRVGLKAGGSGEILSRKTLDSRSPTSLGAAFDCAVYTLAVTGDGLWRGQETSGLENTSYRWTQEYRMKHRGLSQKVYTEFDTLLLLAFFFHSDPVAMAARLVPPRQVTG